MPRPPTETFAFFLDRCLGTAAVPAALRGAGARVELHDDHFPRDCDDATWLLEVGSRGWAVLTKDKHFKRRRVEWAAFQQAGVAAFVLSGGDMLGEEIARAFVLALPRMTRLLAKFDRPLLATVSRGGRLSVKVGHRRGGLRR